MTVYLDNEPLDGEQGGGDCTVADMVDIAKSKLAGTGSLVVGVQCDAVNVGAEQLDAVLSRPAGEYDRVDLISGRPKQVVLHALADAQTTLAETAAGACECADALAAGRLSDAMQLLGRCVNVWGHVHTAILQGGNLLGVSFDDLRIHGKPIADWLKDLSAKLRDIKGAIETRDTVLLGDILRYEMEETLSAWNEMFTAFISHVEQLDEPAP
jgi:hypothetical protein